MHFGERFSFAAIVMLLTIGFAPAADAADSDPFEAAKTPYIQKNTAFWIRIYSEFTEDQGLLHDAQYIDKIFEVVDLRGLDSRGQKRVLNAAKDKWRDVLMAVHQKQGRPETMSTEETRVFQMYKDIDRPGKFLEARQKKRIRFQLGQKNRFLEGVVVSGRYLHRMEEIFEHAGIPKELTRLPLVESSFNYRAYSKVGASGIWQFIRSTGRKYMRVTPGYDERNDPLMATEAAAQLFRENYEALGVWPLALTAYNHGRRGMMKAVRKMGTTDPTTIYQGYSHPAFGFASRNFLMEFLAALHVEQNSERYFGDIKREPPLEFVEVALEHAVSVPILLKHTGLDLAEMKTLNPAVTAAGWKGTARLPKGARLRIPPKVPLETFWLGYRRIPDKFKFRT